MHKLVKWFSENLLSSYFWENGRVMLIFCASVSVIILIALWVVTNGFEQISWKVWLPVIVCVPIMILSILLSLLPNGTGGVTQHFYLGFFCYSLWTLIFTGMGELIIIALKKFIFI